MFLCLLLWQMGSLPLVPPGKPSSVFFKYFIFAFFFFRNDRGKLQAYQVFFLSLFLMSGLCLVGEITETCLEFIVFYIWGSLLFQNVWLKFMHITPKTENTAASAETHALVILLGNQFLFC